MIWKIPEIAETWITARTRVRIITRTQAATVRTTPAATARITPAATTARIIPIADNR